jgi:hypothetical protein
MSDETITVRLTLRKHVAERLRRMCHARGETASHLIDRWVFAHDDRGEPHAVQTTTKTTVEERCERVINDLFARHRR